MFGLDDWIAQFSDGTTLFLVCFVAILLGLRHATDPDHIAAVSTLIASGKERTSRAAATLGFAWGLGHASTLFLFGLPIVLFDKYLPDRAQQVAETAIAGVIVYLAIRLIVRWKRGALHVHPHDHTGGTTHAHLHSHAAQPGHGHAHPARARTPFGAYGIGLVHGMGGSAGVGVLIVASVESEWMSIIALVLLAIFTAVSMTLVTGGFGRALISRPVARTFNGVAPALGATSLAFGIWYATATWSLAPYPF